MTDAERAALTPEAAAVIVELLQRVGGDPDRWTAEQRRAVMHLSALVAEPDR